LWLSHIRFMHILSWWLFQFQLTCSWGKTGDNLSHFIHSSLVPFYLVLGQVYELLWRFVSENFTLLCRRRGHVHPCRDCRCLFISRASHSVCSWAEIGTPLHKLLVYSFPISSLSLTCGREFVQPYTLCRVFSFLLILIILLAWQRIRTSFSFWRGLLSQCFLCTPSGRITGFAFASVPLLTLAQFALVNSDSCHAAIDYV
jgi:hypothetical protein